MKHEVLWLLGMVYTPSTWLVLEGPFLSMKDLESLLQIRCKHWRLVPWQVSFQTGSHGACFAAYCSILYPAWLEYGKYQN